jgi:hypothetical protein
MVRPSMCRCESSSPPVRIASNARVISGVGARTGRHVIGGQVLERAQAVVHTRVDLEDVQPLPEKVDGRQENGSRCSPLGHSPSGG